MIERIQPDGTTAIVRGLFKKETDPNVYLNLKVVTGKGEVGTIEGPFGKSGKLRVSFQGGINAQGRSQEDNAVTLSCRRYVYDRAKKLTQS